MQVLYHASPRKDLKVIRPKRTLSNNKYIGDYVFATSNRVLAAMYLAVKSYATLMNAENTPYIVICGDEEKYLNKDKGGAIYTIAASTFEATPQVGLEESEQISKTAVTPLDKKIYRNSIEAMKEADVTIYFANKREFSDLIKAKDERKRIAAIGLKPASF